jgi:hypothetical protein
MTPDTGPHDRAADIVAELDALRARADDLRAQADLLFRQLERIADAAHCKAQPDIRRGDGATVVFRISPSS